MNGSEFFQEAVRVKTCNTIAEEDYSSVSGEIVAVRRTCGTANLKSTADRAS
jgi:hypothetical protein